jgi:hypothetical protein
MDLCAEITDFVGNLGVADASTGYVILRATLLMLAQLPELSGVELSGGSSGATGASVEVEYNGRSVWIIAFTSAGGFFYRTRVEGDPDVREAERLHTDRLVTKATELGQWLRGEGKEDVS